MSVVVSLSGCCRPVSVFSRGLKSAGLGRLRYPGFHRGLVGRGSFRSFASSSSASSSSSSASSSSSSSSSLPHATLAALCEATQHWITFSDLHVSARTCATCVSVLKTVKQHVQDVSAKTKQKTGVLFLGDFWHEKGALPVAPLNLVMTEVASWNFPALFLVGNHDMADAAGAVHALTPIMAANPAHVHVFDKPAIFLDAMWIPYRQAGDAVQSSMEMAQGQKFSAVFCHLDLAGAKVNNAAQARRGIAPDELVGSTSALRVWAGHYHLPQSVESTTGASVQYVGSPYQVTRAERGQTKRLVVLDRNEGWTEVPDLSLPLDVGPRHFEFDLSSYAMHGAANEYVSALQNVPSMRRGDFARFIVDAEPLSGTNAKRGMLTNQGFGVASLVEHAEQYGAVVDIVRRPPRRTTRFESATTDEVFSDGDPTQGLQQVPSSLAATPLDTWSRFCNIEQKDDVVRKIGSEILGEVAGGDAINPSDGAVDDTAARQVFESLVKDGAPNVLDLHAVEVEGFGPFVEKLKYPLHDRGCVLLVGRIMRDVDGEDLGEMTEEDGDDGEVSQDPSNGAGKTALAFSALWGLTGRAVDASVGTSSGLNASFTSGGGFGGQLVGDVVNDGSKEASVVVTGTLRGVPWKVERVVLKKGLKKLAFTIGNVDVSASESRKTQQLIDSILGVQNLPYTSFFSHSATGGSPASLLRMADGAWKDRLMKLIDGQDFKRAKELAQAKRKGVEVKLVEAKNRRLSCETSREATFRHVMETANKLGVSSTSEFASLRNKYYFNAQKLGLQSNDSDNSVDRADLSNATLYKGGETVIDDEAVQSASRVLGILNEWMVAVQEVRKASLILDNHIVSLSDSSDDVEESSKDREISELEDTWRQNLRELQENRANLQEEAIKQKQAQDLVDNMNKLRTGNSDGEDVSCKECGQPISSESIGNALPGAKQRLVKADNRLRNIKMRLEKARRMEEDAKRRYDKALQEKTLQEAMRMENRRKRQDLVHSKQALDNAIRPMQNSKSEQNSDFVRILEAVLDIHGKDPGEVSQILGDLWTMDIDVSDDYAVGSMQFNSIVSNVDIAERRLDDATRAFDMRRRDAAVRQGHMDNVAFDFSELGAMMEKELKARTDVEKLEMDSVTLKEVIESLGNTGVVSYALDAAVNELEGCTAPYLDALSDGAMSLVISTTRPKASRSKKVDDDTPVAEKVTLTTFIRPSGQSLLAPRKRKPEQLSGGEGKRVALALALGYALAYRRRSTAPRCSLLVLDEVLLHLDQDGRDAAWSLFRSNAVLNGGGVSSLATLDVAPGSALDYRTVVVVAQRGDRESDAAEGVCDATDVVVRDGGGARLEAMY